MLSPKLNNFFWRRGVFSLTGPLMGDPFLFFNKLKCEGLSPIILLDLRRTTQPWINLHVQWRRWGSSGSTVVVSEIVLTGKNFRTYSNATPTPDTEDVSLDLLDNSVSLFKESCFSGRKPQVRFWGTGDNWCMVEISWHPALAGEIRRKTEKTILNL